MRQRARNQPLRAPRDLTLPQPLQPETMKQRKQGRSAKTIHQEVLEQQQLRLLLQERKVASPASTFSVLSSGTDFLICFIRTHTKCTCRTVALPLSDAWGSSARWHCLSRCLQERSS